MPKTLGNGTCCKNYAPRIKFFMCRGDMNGPWPKIERREKKWPTKMYGGQSNVLQPNMVCLVLDWRNAVDWTQRRSIKVSAGPKKVSPDGHQQTVFPRFYRPPGRKSRILPSLLTHLTLRANKKLFARIRHPKPHVVLHVVFYWTYFVLWAIVIIC